MQMCLFDLFLTAGNLSASVFEMILAFIDIAAMFSSTSSTTPSPTSATTPIKPIPVVQPLARLSISFELRQSLDHSTPGSPSEANCHEDVDDDDDDDGDDEDDDENDGDCYDEDDFHLHCVSNVSVCSFEDKVLARNIIILILVAAYANL